MGWIEDHRNTVADRWAQKYRESGMTAKKFEDYLRKTMASYGWAETDIDKMSERIFRSATLLENI
jgi:hypothetical protein